MMSGKVNRPKKLDRSSWILPAAAFVVVGGCTDRPADATENGMMRQASEQAERIQVGSNTLFCLAVIADPAIQRALGGSDVDTMALAGTGGLRAALEAKGIAPVVHGTTRFQPADVGEAGARKSNRLCNEAAIQLTWAISGEPDAGAYEIRASARQGAAEITRSIKRDRLEQWVDGYPADFDRSIRLAKSLAKDNDELAQRLTSEFNWQGASK